jgi:hypothetical protein
MRKILRPIRGPIIINNEYRQRYNSKLYEIYQESHIVCVVRMKRLHWAGHVVIRQGNLKDPLSTPSRKVSWMAAGVEAGQKTRG